MRMRSGMSKGEMKKEGKKERGEEKEKKEERRKGTERRFFSKQGGKGRTEKESSEPDTLFSAFVTHAHAHISPTHALMVAQENEISRKEYFSLNTWACCLRYHTMGSSILFRSFVSVLFFDPQSSP